MQILMELEIPGRNFEKQAKTKFYENRPVGAELFHAGGRTDMTKLIVAFLNFANAPTNATLITVHVVEVCESCGAKHKLRRLSIIPDPTKQAMYWAVETLHTKHFKQNAKSLFSYCRDVENI